MKTTNKPGKSKLLALLLSLMMVSSAGAAFASCTDPDDSSSSVSSSDSSATTDPSDEVKDTGLIKNSDFEIFEKNNGKNVIGTGVSGWGSATPNSTSSGTSTSSKSKSGIIDTSDKGWNYFAGAKYSEDELKALSDAEAIADWDNFTAKDKLAFYEIWEERHPDGDIGKDFEKYQSLNVIERDIPADGFKNPKTHWMGDEADYEDYKDSTHVLMIHNENPDPTSTSATSKTIGLAQKFTSQSTVTVPAGAAAQFSVWVKTADLQTSTSGGASQEAVDRGAYIRVTHSVGAKSLDAYEVKNINTEAMGVTDHNGWKQYTFYLKSTAYADTTFSIVLGLGQSGGTDRFEYVNGYAFFDDLRCELISNETFDDVLAEGVDDVADLSSDNVAKTINTYKNTDKDTFALNFYGANAWEKQSANIFNGMTVSKTESSVGLNTNNFNDAYDVKQSFADLAAIETAAAQNKYLKAISDNFLNDTNEDGTNFLDTLTANKDILMLLSTNGTAYTAESTYTFTLNTDNTDSVPEYMALSFFVKTSDLSAGTGAGVTLVNGLEKTSFSSLNIYDIQGVSIGDTENVYDGWQKCFFFVKLDEELVSSTFQLTFNYGPTDILKDTAKTSFVPGFAAFTGFESYGMTEEEYQSAQSGTYANLVTLKDGVQEEEAAGNNGFDSAKGTPFGALEKGLANPANYKGVYTDNYRVNPTLNPSDTADQMTAKREINTYENAGLLNRDQFENVLTESAGAAWLNGIKSFSSSSNAADIWNDVFGDATQPLFIWNDGASDKAYGFIGSAQTASKGYKAISLRVKTNGGAKASVYLIDTSDDTYQTTLSIGGKLTFWYDDDGNVCTGNPTEKATQIAFKLQSNGLYKANPNWNGYSALTNEQKTAYFANLSAYGEVGSGDLYVSENGASHSYHDSAWDRTAFYLHNGAYYTQDNGAGDKVLNLADLVSDNKLTARYNAQENKYLKVENIETAGEWVTVTFYLNVGDESKDYRLEVWSGTRDSATVNEGGFVAFDYNHREANFDLVEDGKEVAGADYFEGVFSYYDSNAFVRYDASLDSDKVGNLYEKKYTPSSYYESEGVAYLYYVNDEDGYNIFADYALTDVTVEPEIPTEDTPEDSSSDEPADGMNGWLLASSIAVAAVLLLALGSIAVRYIVKTIRKKNGYKAPKKK